MIRYLPVFLILFFIKFSMPAYGVNPDEVLNDPELEKQARMISKDLRCLVCQNQSIDDSDAELARDLRLLVRKKLREGYSPEDVIDYIVARYGNFVLLKPDFSWRNLLLWISPILFLGFGSIIICLNSGGRHHKKSRSPSLTEEEKNNLKQILDDQG